MLCFRIEKLFWMHKHHIHCCLQVLRNRALLYAPALQSLPLMVTVHIIPHHRSSAVLAKVHYLGLMETSVFASPRSAQQAPVDPIWSRYSDIGKHDSFVVTAFVVQYRHINSQPQINSSLKIASIVCYLFNKTDTSLTYHWTKFDLEKNRGTCWATKNVRSHCLIVQRHMFASKLAMRAWKSNSVLLAHSAGNGICTHT